MKAVTVSHLTFKYSGNKPSLDDVSLSVPKGARVAVVGGNGAGKSTFLAVLGGKKMVDLGAASVLGREVFDDTTLQQDVAYMGDWWRGDFFMDITVAECLSSLMGTKRFEEVSSLLEVQMDWRIARLSDGQRRRVQLLAHLAEPKSVYLMDEVTTDLDLVAREQLTRFLKKESEERGATIFYATHIFDNLEGWPTHIIYFHDGKLSHYGPMEGVARFGELVANKDRTPLYTLVREWLFAEKGHR